jgi:hypothetical protein
LENASDVRLGGRLADHELSADLGVREPARKQVEDVLLARSQALERSGWGGGSRWVPRNALIIAGLAFATWETVDIFWISFPAAAAVMAALFLAATIWFWRRDRIRAAVALTLLFGFEGAVAPTLKAMTVTKVADLALSLTGVALAVIVVVARRRDAARESRPVAA